MHVCFIVTHSRHAAFGYTASCHVGMHRVSNELTCWLSAAVFVTNHCDKNASDSQGLKLTYEGNQMILFSALFKCNVIALLKCLNSRFLLIYFRLRLV